MVFDILQNSTLPILKCKFVFTNYDKHDDFLKGLEESKLLFSLYDIKNKKYIILNGKAYYEVLERKIDSNYKYDILLCFQFTEKQTKNVGYFKGEFLIKYENNNFDELRLPIRDELFINIKPSITNSITVVNKVCQ